MRLLLALSAVIVGCSSSSIQFTAVPRTVKLPDDLSTLRASEISQLNEVLLGLSTEQVSSFPVETSLLSVARALAIVNVDSLELMNVKGRRFSVEVDGYNLDSLEQTLASTFGADRESVKITKDGAYGSELSQAISAAQIADNLVKIKSEPLRSELIQVYKLVSALNTQGAKLVSSNSPDIFQITITGLSSLVDMDDRNNGIIEIQKAVTALTKALVDTYGDQAVVEIVCNSDAIKEADTPSGHNIVKRAADEPDDEPTHTKYRKMYQVYVNVSPDYPAMFAIFAGISILLAIAVVYIAVGIWNMDPGRDSIIYRMTTTRMKKD